MNRIIIAGRNSSCNYILPDQYASKQHLQIIITVESEVYIVDLNSKSGTTINGHLIEPNIPVKLNDYDIVRAADTLIPWKKFLYNESLKKPLSAFEYDEYLQTLKKMNDEGSNISLKKKRFVSFFKEIFKLIV